MRRRRGIVLALAAALGGVHVSGVRAQPPRPNVPAARPAQGEAVANAAPAINPQAAAEMERLLVAWERQSAKLQSLEVEIERTDKSPAWDDELYRGRAFLKAPNLACLDFKKVELDEKGKPKLLPNGKEKLLHYEQIRCTGKEVWQYKFETKQIFVFPIDKANQRSALEEGPLPFLFNMRAAEAKKRYFMKLKSQDAKSYTISVLPRLDLDKDAFSEAILQLDRQYLLPTRIMLLSPAGKGSKDFVLSNIKANDPDEKRTAPYFVGTAVPKGWQLIRNPGAGMQQQGVGPVAPRGPARPPQPAMRPRPANGRN